VLRYAFLHICSYVESSWGTTWTIGAIGKIFPMFELTLDSLEKAVQHLMKRYQGRGLP
jgi:uncharacterized protein with von Willebrand factor type A (vWA) domain